MKALFFFVLGGLIGAYLVHAYDGRHPPAPPQSAAAGAEDSLDRKLADWNLTPDDIRADLARSGQVVREQARQAGEEISDVRIEAVIKAKYVLDRDISALDVSVRVRHGQVLLTGTVSSDAVLGRAVALALDTSGVVSVVAKLAVQRPAVSA